MKWSKVKKLTEASFAQALRKRIGIYATTYRKPNSSLGRGWITIDGIELIDFSSFESARVFACYYSEHTKTFCAKHPEVQLSERTEGLLMEKGEFSRFDLMTACFDFIHANAHSCLKEKNPLLRMLAVLSSKVGKAKVKNALNDEHPLVRYMAMLRLEHLAITKLDKE